jgi:hypothetical protein
MARGGGPPLGEGGGARGPMAPTDHFFLEMDRMGRGDPPRGGRGRGALWPLWITFFREWTVREKNAVPYAGRGVSAVHSEKKLKPVGRLGPSVPVTDHSIPAQARKLNDIAPFSRNNMSYSRKVSHHNSTWNKEIHKALSAADPSAVGDFGSALAAVQSVRCISSGIKSIPRAPTEAMKMPNKEILHVRDDKLKVKDSSDDIGFAVKSAPKGKSSSGPSKTPKKIVDPTFFAPSTVEEVVARQHNSP